MKLGDEGGRISQEGEEAVAPEGAAGTGEGLSNRGSNLAARAREGQGCHAAPAARLRTSHSVPLGPGSCLPLAVRGSSSQGQCVVSAMEGSVCSYCRSCHPPTVIPPLPQVAQLADAKLGSQPRLHSLPQACHPVPPTLAPSATPPNLPCLGPSYLLAAPRGSLWTRTSGLPHPGGLSGELYLI